MPFETISIEDVPGAQIIKIPNDFKIDDDKVYLKKVGNSLHIIPFHNPWQNMIESLEEFTPDFMNPMEYGRIRSVLEKGGTPIGPLDTLIAAHAKALGLILVTNNEKEFSRIDLLKIENWTKP